MKTFRGSGLSSVYSVETTKDNGFALAGYTSSYLAANSYAWLIKVGGMITVTTNAPIEKINGTSSVSPTQSLIAVPTGTLEISPAEKAAGFEGMLVITILLTVYIVGRKRR